MFCLVALISTSLEHDLADETPSDKGYGQGEEYSGSGVNTGASIPDARSQAAGSSFSGTQNLSTHDGESSQNSTEVSDPENYEDNFMSECDPLERVIRDALGPEAPEVSRLLFLQLQGWLECVPQDPNEQFDDINNMPLLSVLAIQDNNLVPDSGAYTTQTASSTSGSSSTSNDVHDLDGGGAKFSSTGGNYNSGEASFGQGDIAPNDNQPGQSTKQQNTVPSTSSESTAITLFRCIHNALYPEVFCVTQETQRKYVTCAGPGWNTIQHLK